MLIRKADLPHRQCIDEVTMIRLIIILLVLVVFAVLSVPGLAVLFLVSRINKKAVMCASKGIVGWMGKLVFLLAGCSVTVKGLENLNKDETYLFVSNHRSIFDAVGGFSYTPGPLAFVAKKQSAKIPIISQYMKLTGCLFLDRTDIRQGFQTIMSAIEMVKDGTSMWICPEGTRNRKENYLELLDFHDASFKIAVKGNVRVIPVAVTGTAEIFEKQAPLVRSSKVIFHYGEPVAMDSLEPEDRKRPGIYFRKRITEMLEADKY